MLLKFSVENYLSFKTQVLLSLIPAKDNSHIETNLIRKDKFEGLNTIAIYGANASGKTNLFKAITTALNIIRRSSEIQIGQTLPVVPFIMDKESRVKPSSFEFQFIAKDNKKYIYGFSAFADRIDEEYLYYYRTNQPTKVFDRTNTREYTFSSKTKSELAPLTKVTTDNKLFISTATAWNAAATRNAYEWLSKGIDTFANIQGFQDIAFSFYKRDLDNRSTANLEFTTALMKAADLNIDSIEYKYHLLSELPVEIPRITINNQAVLPRDGVAHEVRTAHLVTDEQGAQMRYQLPLEEESQGTAMLFFYGPLIKDTLDRGKVLVVDEIDKSLHPFIVSYLVGLFSDPNQNKNGAQLVITTHDTSQLSLKRFRRDQIYFTEKNYRTGVSDLYSLADFEQPVRKDDNIQKKYLQGRYGAIPYVHAEDIL